MVEKETAHSTYASCQRITKISKKINFPNPEIKNLCQKFGQLLKYSFSSKSPRLLRLHYLCFSGFDDIAQSDCPAFSNIVRNFHTLMFSFIYFPLPIHGFYGLCMYFELQINSSSSTLMQWTATVSPKISECNHTSNANIPCPLDHGHKCLTFPSITARVSGLQ